MPNEIPIFFHNGSKYNYFFIIKELANEFEGPFECIGENSEIYTVPHLDVFCAYHFLEVKNWIVL